MHRLAGVWSGTEDRLAGDVFMIGLCNLATFCENLLRANPRLTFLERGCCLAKS
jgi:hypothetical protein